VAGNHFPELTIPDTGPILVGLSGGLDSTVLLRWLSTQPAIRAAGLRALHVHHGLQAEAEHWVEHCRELCARLGVPIAVARVEVRNDLGLGREAAARDARHAAFAAELHAGETLALGHHRDDQAETVLLRLLRGSGSDGLAAMRDTRPFATGIIWRPLLGTPRKDLLGYANAHSLSWIEDPSNQDTRLDRNFLRHRVLPVLAERWPHATVALAQSARWLEEDATLIDSEARRRLRDIAGDDPRTLSVPKLLALEPAWRARVLRCWRSTLGFSPWPESAHAVVESQVLAARPDALPEYRWPGGVLRRWHELLYIDHPRPSLPENWSCEWDGREPLALPTGDTLALVFVGGPSGPDSAAERPPTKYCVSARVGGERIRLPGRSHSHSLKHVLQTRDIPPWQRNRMPLLFAADGELLAAGDSVMSARFDKYCRAHGLRVHFDSW
jgi:tRNA(Ile)-lysidine synthase